MGFPPAVTLGKGRPGLPRQNGGHFWEEQVNPRLTVSQEFQKSITGEDVYKKECLYVCN